MSEPELCLASHDETLVILDEVHRLPDLFQVLHGLIVRHRRAGRHTGQFLLLGSASIDLLKKSCETRQSEKCDGELGFLTTSTIRRWRVSVGGH
ncbi:hypothetical protein ASC97_31000 [Rhizobium sp. Root1203]|uniref:AAA family ATPase n=1 Tax=Rhizobium sp. Root1203 TaxID=1736427 RepID=UPI00070FCB2D|nr:AAA family ATPase [Rhizobium sp. Root1203]KQV15904.1 hypothetical protein ASC97_31000 [Rhizobium sp. Root1203]